MHVDAILRAAGFRATPGRVALLKVLQMAQTPLSVKAIVAKLKPKKDGVTVYRALEALAQAGIVERVDLQHGHSHYELVVGRTHHHHLICNSCGAMEDVTHCPVSEIEKAALRNSKKFSSIESHALELFGICTNCA